MTVLALQDIRSYVRQFIDVDVTDIPDGVLDLWTADGFARMIRSERPWPFYLVGGTESGYTITTQVGVQTYTLPTVTVQGRPAQVPVRNLVGIQGPHWELEYTSQPALESTFPPGFVQSAEPSHFSIWNPNGVTLWPIPNSVYTLNVRAYRDPIDWIGIGAGGQVDAPDDFHMILAEYVLAQAWAQQTDLEQSGYWLQQFEKGVAELKANYLRAPMIERLILNGGKMTRGEPPRLRFPFEGLSAGVRW